MPLNSVIPWTQKMIQHREWWLSSHSMLQGEFSKADVIKLQTQSNCTRLVKKNVDLGPGGTITLPPLTDSTSTLSAKTTTEQPIPQQPRIPEPPHLVSRTSL